MKNFLVICICTALLVSSSLVSALESQTSEQKPLKKNSTHSVIEAKQVDKKLVDGTTSASKLRAKRSHSVSKQDENGLTIFFGLIVLSVIGFFMKPFSERK